MYCHRCGKEIDESVYFCPNCGAARPTAEQPPAEAGPTTTSGTPQPLGYVRQPVVAPAPYQVPPKRSTPVVAIVIGIIAVVVIMVILLIAIAVPVYLSARSNAQRRTCQSNQRIVDGAIQGYEAMSKDPVYPTGFGDMLRPETQTLMSIPTCPSSDKPYIWVEGSPPHISCPNESTHVIE